MQRISFILGELESLFRQSPVKAPFRLAYWTSQGTLRPKLRYHRERRLILESGLFDHAYYARAYPAVTIEPLHHYLTAGAAEGFNPNLLFDASHYASQYTDGLPAGWNPLVHFLLIGGAEGKSPHPLFDSAYYLGRNPDVAEAGVNPLQHYLRFGAKEGRDPHPLFDTTFYLEKYPAVAQAGISPLEHYVDRGFRERCAPHWMFDPSFYLARNPDVAAAGVNPLLHFIQFGAKELRDPHPLFDISFYLSSQPDVRRSGMNPLEHFVRYGAQEGRSPHFLFDFNAYLSLHPDLRTFQSAAKHAGRAVSLQFSRGRDPRDAASMARFIQNHRVEVYDVPRLSLSVVMPTCNRVDVLEGTLQRCLQVSRNLPVEFMIVSDGSTDRTLNCLDWYSRHHDNLRYAAIEKSGPAAARNLGIARTRGDLIMFMGDDIRPVDSEFFAAHLRAHERLFEAGTVVEGHVQWPNQPGFQINAVMRLIQGRGAQQFSYHYMQPHGFFDWRHFWSANISVKRNLVNDWTKEGFSPRFDSAAYEDIEFAYRTSKSRSDLRIYYAAESVGEHFHPHNLITFIKRQINAGEMARKLVDLHPELSSFIHVEEIDQALRSSRPDAGDTGLLPDFQNIIRGVKSWGAVMEAHQDLGTQEWHDAFLNALFQLCHGEGYLNTFHQDGGNIAEGYRVLLRMFQQQMATSRSAVPILHAIALS
jgi:glycosyltransferase involved in cell wall biosynthesis